MSVLNDIWGFIKRNTLDKTNLDEQIVGGVKNFFNAPAQQVLQRRSSTFQYNPPPPPIIQPPKLPSNDVQSRISLLKQKLTLAGNEGIDNLKSIFKVNPSLTKAGDVDSSFGGQILKNAKDLAIKKGIIPIQKNIQDWTTTNPAKAQALQTWQPLFQPIQTAKKSLTSQNIKTPTQFASKVLNSVGTDFPKYTENVSNAFLGKTFGPIVNAPTKYFQNVMKSGVDTIINTKDTVSDLGKGDFKQAGSDLLKTAGSALNTAFRLNPTAALPWLGYEIMKGGSAVRVRDGSYADQLRGALDAFTGDKTVGLGTSLTKDPKLEQFLNTAEGVAFLAYGLHQGWRTIKNWNDLRIKNNVLKNIQYSKDMNVLNKYGLNEKDFLNKDLLKNKYRDVIKQIYPRKLGEDDAAFKEFQLVFNRMIGNYYKGVSKNYTPPSTQPVEGQSQLPAVIPPLSAKPIVVPPLINNTNQPISFTKSKNLNKIMTTNKPQSQDFTDFMNGKIKDTISSPVTYKQPTTPTKSIKQSGNLGDIMSDMKNIETTVKTPEELATKYPIEQPIADWVKVKNENGLSLTQTALVRDLATAMKKSTNNHDLTKSIPKLVKIVKNNPEDMYPAIRTSADFSVKGNLKPWWKYWLKTEIPQWKQNEIDANKSLLTTEPPFQKPVSTKLSDLMSKKTVEAPMTKQQPLTTNISDTTKPFQVKTPSTGQSTSISQKKNKTLDEILASRDPENLINEKTKNLDTFISKEKIKSNVEAEFEGKRFLENHEDIKLQLYKATDKKGVPRTDLTDIIQGKKEIPKGLEKVIGAVRVYVSKLHSFRENPELGYIKDFYLQHIKQEDIANEIQKIKLGSDLWLPDNVMDLGSTKTRKGTLDLTHSKDFEKVWDRMGNEAMYDKYKGNFNITPEQREFRKNIIETIKTEVEANIEPKKSKLNIVRESTKAQGITNPKDIEYKYRIGIQRFNGFLDAMKREDIPLANSARRVRDAWRDEMDFIEDVNKIDSITWSKNIVKELGLKEEQIKIIKNGLDKRNPDEKQIYAEAIVRGMTKKRIQNFIDDVGKYRFTTNTEKYLNEQINRMLKVNLLREGLYSKAVKVATGLTYRAQILGNLSVGMQQKFESFRIPAFYKTKDVIQGIKRRITDIAKRRDILKDIKFEENDFRQLRQQINNYTKQNPDNIFTKFDEFLNKVGGAFIKFTENSKNKDYATVAEVVGENKGLKGQELKDFIRDEVFTNAYIMDKFNTPEFLQKSATGRALGQYSQYFWKDTERILDAAGVEKDTPLALKLLLVKALTMVITAAITGAGIDSIKRVAFPIGIGPAVTAMWEAGKIIYNVEQEKKRAKLDPENDNTFYRDSQKSNWTKLALGNVVPFGAQYKKTSGALDVSNKGYDETVTGRITHKSEDNPLVTWQTLAFGKGVGKTSRNYYAKEGGLFGTGESIPFTNIQGKRKYTSIPPTRSKLIKDMFERGDVEGGRDAIDKYRIRQDINRDFNKSLTPTETEKLKSFYKPKEKDALGNVIPNPQDSITIAGNKWNYFDVFQKEASKQREIASKTGEPINPIYNLLPEQQKIILRIQASPPGSQDAKDLKDFSSEWIADYYADQRKYSTVMKEKGLFTDNPYYDAMTVKVSPELQEKLDFYGTLPKGTGARSKFYKANPDVAEFFDASTKLTNEKRLMLGLLPTDYSKSNGYGSRSNFNSKLYYALKDIMKSYTDRKTLNKSLADLMSKKPKVKSLVQLMKKNKKKVDTNKSLDAILKEYQTKLFGKKKI